MDPSWVLIEATCHPPKEVVTWRPLLGPPFETIPPTPSPGKKTPNKPEISQDSSIQEALTLKKNNDVMTFGGETSNHGRKNIH